LPHPTRRPPAPTLFPYTTLFRSPSMRTATLKKRGRFRRSRLLVARSSRRFGPVSRASSRLSLAAQRELHGDLHHALHGARAATGGHERPLLYGAERSVVEDPRARGGGDAHVHDAAVHADEDG